MKPQIKTFFRYSIFVLSGLLFYFYFNSSHLKRRRQLFQGTPCIAGLNKLERRIEKNWKLECVDNNLKVDIFIQDNNQNNRRAFFFKELANQLLFISQNTPEANLENIKSIHVILSSPSFKVEALTKGKSLVLLKNFKGPESIKEHLKNTVQVKESVK